MGYTSTYVSNSNYSFDGAAPLGSERSDTALNQINMHAHVTKTGRLRRRGPRSYFSLLRRKFKRSGAAAGVSPGESGDVTPENNNVFLSHLFQFYVSIFVVC